MARSRQKSGGRAKSSASVKKTTRKSKEQEALSRKRRLEVLGLVVMAVAVLLGQKLIGEKVWTKEGAP